MNRPPLNPALEQGILRAHQFQIAYATNDIDTAKTLFQKRLGIAKFKTLTGPLPSGGEIHIELAWVGSTMYELLTAKGPGSDIYVGRLPETTSLALAHHHLGYLIETEQQWQQLLEQAQRSNWAIPHISHTPGFMHSCFIDVPLLGHYCEYLFPEPAGLAFLTEQVPNN